MQIPIHAIYMQLADASRMPEMAFVRCEFGNKHCKTIIAHVLGKYKKRGILSVMA